MESANPTVTVILITFNRAAYCKEAMESILSQTYADFELIVLDNSSKDNTEEVVKSFNDSRIVYIRHEPMNIARARNLGWQTARGSLVAYLDDDDRWLPNKLQAQVELLGASTLAPALTYGGFVKIDNAGSILGTHTPELRGMILLELLAQKDPFTGSASNPLIKKSVIEELGGYNDSVVTGEDWELYLRLAEKHPIDCTPQIVLQIRHHDGPRLGDKLKEAAELELAVMARYPHIFTQHPKLASFYFQKVGGKFCRTGERQKGRAYISKAIAANRLNLKAYVQYALSFVKPKWYRRVHKLYITYAKGW